MPKVYIKGKAPAAKRSNIDGPTLSHRIDAAHPMAKDSEPASPSQDVALMAIADETASNAPLTQSPALADLPPAPKESLAAVAGREPSAAAEQLQLQGSQLASILRAKQQELDERESRLNAMNSELEKKSRLSRLAQTERAQDFQQREAELQQRIAQLEQRATELSMAELADQRQRSETDEDAKKRNEDLAEKMREVDNKLRRLTSDTAVLEAAMKRHDQEKARTAAAIEAERQKLALEKEASENSIKQLLLNIDQERAALTQREQSLAATNSKKHEEMYQTQVAALRERELRVQARETQLDQLESVNREQWSACENERRQLESMRSKLESEAVQERTEIAQQRENSERMLEEKRTDLMRREDELERHRAAVEQLHTVVSHQHRETLELRLVTEQLWSQLSGRQNAVELTQSVATLRHQLADEYRLANESLAEQKQELRRLAERLDEQQLAIRKQRNELQEWVRRRHEEIEGQAARLVAREQELDRQQSFYDDAKQQYETDRRALQKQVRDLTAQLRPGHAALSSAVA